jgi:hypothetical protein
MRLAASSSREVTALCPDEAVEEHRDAHLQIAHPVLPVSGADFGRARVAAVLRRRLVDRRPRTQKIRLGTNLPVREARRDAQPGASGYAQIRRVLAVPVSGCSDSATATVRGLRGDSQNEPVGQPSPAGRVDLGDGAARFEVIRAVPPANLLEGRSPRVRRRCQRRKDVVEVGAFRDLCLRQQLRRSVNELRVSEVGAVGEERSPARLCA